MKQEYILCAAIWYKEQSTGYLLPTNCETGVVICGHRHPHCIASFIALTGKRSVLPECGEYTQGFLTNRNRFVDREEGGRIAFEASQTEMLKETLFSEDLY